MEIKLSSLIYVIGVAYSLLFLWVINRKHPLKSTLQKTASSLLVCMAIMLIYYIVILNQMALIYPYVDSLGNAAWMALTPLFFLFVKSVYKPEWKPRWFEFFYLLFPFIFLGEALISHVWKDVWLFQLAPSATAFLDIWMLVFFGTGLFFVIRALTLQLTRPYALRPKYLYWFTLGFLTILGIYTVAYLLIRQHYVVWFELSLVIGCELFVFVLIYKTFSVQSVRKSLGGIENKGNTYPLKTWASSLEKKMEEQKPYLNKRLTLKELAVLLDIGEQQLTYLFKEHYNSNFYEFVHEYRLEHVEKLMRNPAKEQFTIIALAEESGFNSKATFYKVFKEKHQMTPSAYLKDTQKDA